MTDWENRLLEKHIQVVLKGWLPHQATGKAVQSASRWTKRMYPLPHNSKYRWRGRDQKRCGHKVTCSTTVCVCVCCFWLIGVFCFCVCSVLTAAWKLLDSVLDHFILLKPFQQNGQNHQLVAGVKSNSMTTFKY